MWIKSIFLLFQVFFVCSFSASIRKPFFTTGSNDAVVFEKNRYEDVPAVKVCDVDKTVAKNVSIKYEPLKPVKGLSFNISVNYTLNEDVTNGISNFELKIGFIPVKDEKKKLCDFLEEQHNKCPLKKGNGSMGIYLPSEFDAVGGHHTGFLKLKDQNGYDLLCLNFDYNI